MSDSSLFLKVWQFFPLSIGCIFLELPNYLASFPGSPTLEHEHGNDSQRSTSKKEQFVKPSCEISACTCYRMSIVLVLNTHCTASLSSSPSFSFHDSSLLTPLLLSFLPPLLFSPLPSFLLLSLLIWYHSAWSLAGSGDPRSNWKGTSKTQREHWDCNWTTVIIHVQCGQTMPQWQLNMESRDGIS